MTETKLIEMLDKNPNLLQHFPNMREPLIRRIKLKYWGTEYINSDNHETVDFLLIIEKQNPMKNP